MREGVCGSLCLGLLLLGRLGGLGVGALSRSGGGFAGWLGLGGGPEGL